MHLSRDQVRWRLMQLMTDVAGVPAAGITDEARLDVELEVPSVALLELQVAIEDEYEIEIDPLYIVRLNRFGAIVDHVHRAASGAAKRSGPGRSTSAGRRRARSTRRG